MVSSFHISIPLEKDLDEVPDMLGKNIYIYIYIYISILTVSENKWSNHNLKLVVVWLTQEENNDEDSDKPVGEENTQSHTNCDAKH